MPLLLRCEVESWEREKVGLQVFLAVDSAQAWPLLTEEPTEIWESPWFVALANGCKNPQQISEQVLMWFVPAGELPGCVQSLTTFHL